MSKPKAHKRPSRKKSAAPAGETQGALSFARLLATPDPAEQLNRLQAVLAQAQAPVFTLVIQVDSRRADPEADVWMSNVGAPIPGPVINMMLAAAQRSIAQQQVAQDAAAKQAAAQAPATAKATVGAAGKGKG